MWRRAAWVVSIGIIAMVVQFGHFRSQYKSISANESLGRVSVTKACEPPLSKAVLISDDPPNESRIADPWHWYLFTVALRESCSNALPRSGTGRQDKLPAKQFLDWENFVVLWHAACAIPLHISRTQMADVAKDYPPMNAVGAILMRLYSIGLDTYVGALENFSVAELSFASCFGGVPQGAGRTPQANSRNRQDNRKHRHDAFIVTADDAISPLNENPHSDVEGGAILLISLIGGCIVLLWAYDAFSRP